MVVPYIKQKYQPSFHEPSFLLLLLLTFFLNILFLGLQPAFDLLFFGGTAVLLLLILLVLLVLYT